MINRCDVIHLDREVEEVGCFPHEDWPTIGSMMRVKSIRKEGSKVSEETRSGQGSRRRIFHF